MKQAMKDLQKLRGVGEILAKRFAEAGFDSFEKIAAAGVEGLKRIPGTQAHALASIVTQAEELAKQAGQDKAQRVEELRQQSAALKGHVQTIAVSVRDRFQDKLAGEKGKRVEKEILRVITALEKVEGSLATRTKKSGKGLAKAQKRLVVPPDAGLKKIGKVLRKARKSLKNAIA